MNRGVRAISLDYLADLTHRENISCKPSPESQKIRTLEEEVKNLTLNKRTLINAIDSANRVTTTFILFRKVLLSISILVYVIRWHANQVNPPIR